MSVLLRKQYSSIKKEKLSEQAKSVLKSMYDTTDGFKDAKATRKIKPKFEAFYNKLKESKPDAIVGGKAKSKAVPKKSPEDFKAARARRKPQTGVPKDKKAVDKDATRPAISKRGRRVSKAGNTYYEYRDNRFDKNPSKYPMLEKGGMMAKGGKVLMEIDTHKAIKDGDKIKIYRKELEFDSNYDIIGEKMELLYSIPSENEDDLLPIFDDFEETNRVLMAEANSEFGMAKGGYMAKGGKAGKMYYHILEYGDYGNIGYQGYYETLEDAKNEINRLSGYFPDMSFQIFTSDSTQEPPITTMAEGGYMAKGGMMAKGARSGMKIKDWYIKNYPTDDLGEEINDTITFKGYWGLTSQGSNPYKVLGVPDSVVRERVEEKLSEMLDNSKMAKGGMSQGYDDREDERLGMEHGKMSTKDLDSTHARRDDARFEERMAKGGEVSTKLKMLKEKSNGYFPKIEPTKERSYYLWETPNAAKSSFIIESRSVYSDVGSSFYIYDKDYKFLGSANELNGFNYVKPLRITKSDVKFEDGGYMADGGGFNQYGEPYGFEEETDSVYEIHHKPEMNPNNPYLIWDKIDGVYIAEFPNRERALHFIDYKKYGYAKGGYMAKGGETHRLDGIFEDGGEIAEGNLEMAMSNVKAIGHHAMELKSLLNENTSIEAWVVAKLERAETDLSDVTHYIDGLQADIYNMVIIEEEFAKGGYMENGGETMKEAYIEQVVEIATKANQNGIKASDLTFEEFSNKVFEATNTSYGKDYLRGAYQVMKNKGYARGGELTPYVIWVSKDGEKREMFGEYKSKRAADMKMNKLWESGEYKTMGNKPKSMYEKEGFYGEGGMMAKGTYIASQEETEKAKKVWQNMSYDERIKFLKKQYRHDEDVLLERLEIESKKNWDDLAVGIQMDFEKNLFFYEKGGYMADGGLTEKDKLSLKILKALSGFNDGKTLNGLLELLGYSQYRFGKYATENQVNDVKKELKSLIKLGYVEESGIGYKQTSNGRKYLDSFDYGSYAEGGMMAKGGGIYSSDSLYILQVLKNGEEVAREKFRAKSLKEAKEISEDEFESMYIENLGDGVSFIVLEAMEKGGRLSRKQKQLDLNKNGKLDSQDFKMLRAGRKNARKK